MKNKVVYILLITFFVTLSFSCSDDTLDFSDYQQQLVVDGWIEQDQYPKVYLTKSSGYFENIDSLSIRNLVVTNAKVEVSDGQQTEILTLKRNNEYFPPYYYQATKLKGQIGKEYTLTVYFENNIITAKTTIPGKVELDTAYFERLSPTDTIGFLKGAFTDNPNKKNYYRLLTKRKNIDKNYTPTYIPNFDDLLFTQESFEFIIYKGNENWLNRQNNYYYSVGDTVSIKVCEINKETFEYWLSIQSELQNVGNPLATSTATVNTNLSSGIGFWAGYGVSYKTVIAK